MRCPNPDCNNTVSDELELCQDCLVQILKGWVEELITEREQEEAEKKIDDFLERYA